MRLKIAIALTAFAAAGLSSVAAATARGLGHRSHKPAVPVLRLPSGASFSEQWALRNTGQYSGTPGADIDVERAWQLVPGGNAAVVVGMVDTGVDFDEPNLAHANLYTQAGAQAGAGDARCAAASYGCSFLGGFGTPSDENGHGTATAGEIFGGWEEGSYAGVAPNSTLIVAQVLDGSSAGTTDEEAAGLDYVADHGARVVNVSISGPPSAAVHQAIASHPETLFVAAAGNSGADADADGAGDYYPCADPSPNVICVAASDPSDALASFSDYGARSVDLAAPGVHIASSAHGGYAAQFGGTSFAAPLVSGVAALAFAERPVAAAAQVKQAILGSVDVRPGLAGKTVTGGRLNAYKALLALAALLPAPPPANTKAPGLGGRATVGTALTATAGAWSQSPSSSTISWERCDSAGGHCQLVAGAGGARYKLTSVDAGARLRARVLATNAAGSEIAFSSPSAIVRGRSAQSAGAREHRAHTSRARRTNPNG
ncbi:MAG TPA: S8 family serine peptidase [Solirubrobacteraceae bacterium]|nr:S8 family serine peptidase [Solirubrobacteraceae bacterium]